MATGKRSKGTAMRTVMAEMDTRINVRPVRVAPAPAQPVRRRPRTADARRRPGPGRAAGAPVRYRGTGVLMSRTPHRRRPITPFTTVETAVLAVVKRSGVTEPFSREKVISGVRRACQGRQVDDDALNLLAQQVEDAVRAGGSPEVPSNEVGLAILGPLRELDEVAYLRFASVYRSFSSAEDFEREIQALREHRAVITPS